MTLDLDLNISYGFARVSNETKGTNPEQLFAAGYAACFESSILGVAASEKIAIKNTSVTARVHLMKGKSGFYLKAELEVSLPGIATEKGNGLLEKAHKQCPYSKAINGNIDVKTKLL